MVFTQLTLWLDRIIRLVLGLLFISAGVIKLHDPEAFTVVIDAFGFVPGSWTGPISIVLPIIEILVGAGLIFDLPLSLHAMTLLLIFFMALLAYGMHLGLDIDCGCYGPEDPESRAFGGLRTAFYRDLFMSAGIALLYARRLYNFIHVHRNHNFKEESP